jgi:hypothetical protein
MQCDSSCERTDSKMYFMVPMRVISVLRFYGRNRNDIGFQ